MTSKVESKDDGCNGGDGEAGDANSSATSTGSTGGALSYEPKQPQKPEEATTEIETNQIDGDEILHTVISAPEPASQLLPLPPPKQQPQQQQHPADDFAYESSSDTPPDAASDGIAPIERGPLLRPPLAIPAPGAVVETMTGPAQSITSNGELSARMVLTEEAQVASEYLKSTIAETGGDIASVVSMPAVPMRAELSTEPTRTYSDSSTVASAPAVVVGADVDDMDFPDELFSSPDGQSSIAERSPGGRYIRFMEKLGSGASKDVYRAYDTQEGIEVAWNVVNLSGVPKTERNRIVNEVRLLERLHHHNIISFHGSWVNRERQEVNFVTEILSSGTLKSFIKKVQVIRWKIAKRWAVQILKGLEYLHSQDPPVIHRDLKCENIFINGTSGDLRIGDLGLSTVHRNGKVLSVLGTPEFMAPDMYEENSYDEKVDIYAFGMCLLEIFTKEIPYKECSNPAQIYKKVIRGDPPESLSRLKSRHAREFIELCLGYRNDEGNYVRPTAVELLTHDFLLKRPTDDDEVEVEPPLQERVIRETSTESSPSVVTNRTPSTKSKKRAGVSNAAPQGISGNPSDTSPRTKYVRSNSVEEDESDRFEEMPDSEVNIRNVKVMIGRGQELMDAEESPGFEPGVETESQQYLVSASVSGDIDSPMDDAPQPPMDVDPPSPPLDPQVDTLADDSDPPASPFFHYLVAAAVIPNESDESRPYADEILKLVVTLPVDGLTRNVQFDFHLVEDDPVQVAKEMVSELRIPQEAVLEVSETISGLARAARMRQDRYLTRLMNSQQSIQPQNVTLHSQHQTPPNQGNSQSSNTDGPSGVMPLQEMGQMGEYHSRVIQPENHSPMPDYSNTQQSQPQPLQVMPLLMQHQEPTMPMHMGQPISTGAASMIPGQTPPQHTQSGEYQVQASDVHSQNAPGAYGHALLSNNPPSQYDFQNSQIEGQSQAMSLYGGHISSGHSQAEFPNNHGNSDVQVSQNQGFAQPTQLSKASRSAGDFQQSIAHASPPGPYVPSQPQTGHGAGRGRSDSNTSQQQTLPQSFAQAPPQNGIQYASLDQPANFSGRSVVQRRTPPSSRQGSDGQIFNGDVSSSQQQGSFGPMHSQNAPSQQQSLPNPAHAGQLGPSGIAQHHQMPPSQESAVPPSQVHAFNNEEANPMANRGVAPPRPMPTVQLKDSSGTGSQSEIVPTQQGSNPLALPNGDNLSRAIRSSSGVSLDSLTNGTIDGFSVYDNVDSGDDLAAAELRKLDEDFRKNMMRAKKVFVNRMDNLQRTHHQREAQHQKTLEKHQKERAEFEKRMQQEEIEQNRRIEQLQKEWDRQREAVRMKKSSDGDDAPKTTLQNGKHAPSSSSVLAENQSSR